MIHVPTFLKRVKSIVLDSVPLRTIKQKTIEKEELVGIVKKTGRVLSRVILYLLLLDMAYVFLYPFIIMVLKSLMSFKDLNDITVIWIPTSFHVKNYFVAMQDDMLDYAVAFKNSVLVAIIPTTLHILSCSLAGYAFARYRFPGRNILFLVVIIQILVPPQLIVIPSFIVNHNILHLTNSIWPIVIPTVFGMGLKSGLYIYIFRQFFLNLPKGLEEAARIDGCGFIRTHFQIVLPTSTAATLVTGVLAGIWHWNDEFETALYLWEKHKQTILQKLPDVYLWIEEAFQRSLTWDVDQTVYTEAVVYASTFLCVLPPLIVYVVVQKKFIEGIQHTGLKS